MADRTGLLRAIAQELSQIEEVVSVEVIPDENTLALELEDGDRLFLAVQEV